jgi:hypothetical protein
MNAVATLTTTAGPDVAIVKVEEFDVELAEWIVNNKDIPKNEREAVRRLLKDRVRGNKHDTTYKLGKDIKHEDLGRFHAKGGVGLQCCWADTRAALAQRYYWDVDIRNAQPTLLQQYAQTRGWICEVLKHFNEHRDEYIEELRETLHIERWEAKEKICRVMFGGSCEGMTSFFVNQLQPELRKLMENVFNENKSKYPSIAKKPNAVRSMMANVLQTEERTCLMAMDTSLAKQGRSLDVLIHDGGLVRKKDGEGKIPDEVLRKCERDVFETTGYKISLAVKDLKTTLSGPVEEDDEVIDDAYAARKLCELLGGHLILDSDEIWVFNKAIGMWSNDKSALERVITSLNGKLVFRRGMKVFDYSGCVEKRNSLIKMLPAVAPIQNGYFRSRISSDYGKMLFTDGIYDFTTGVFTTEFDSNIVFRHSCPRKFPGPRDREKMEFINRMCFVEPFKNPLEAKRIKHNLMRAMIGDWRRKKCVNALGPKNSGKSILIFLTKTAFGDYVGTFDANAMLLRHGGEAARDLLWISDIHDCRFAFSSEIKQDDSAKMPSIDGNMLKKLVGGSDEVSFRKMNATHATRVYFLATIFVMANDMPKIVPCSEEIKDRIEIVDYHYSFQPNPTELHHKKVDKTIGDKFAQSEYGDAFISLLTEEYEEWKQSGFAELPACENDIQDDMMEVVDVKNILLGDYELTGNHDDSVETKEIQTYLRRNGFVGSETKITREMKQIGLGVTRIQKNRQRVKVYTGVRMPA